MRPWLLAGLTWLLTTLIVTPVTFFLVLLLAGPHSSLLPNWLGGPTLALGWILTLGLPMLAARYVCRRVRHSPPA